MKRILLAAVALLGMSVTAHAITMWGDYNYNDLSPNGIYTIASPSALYDEWRWSHHPRMPHHGPCTGDYESGAAPIQENTRQPIPARGVGEDYQPKAEGLFPAGR